jgi:predicted metal-dependent peptidase
MTTATSTQNKDEAKKFADLVGAMDPKLDREVRELLVTARVGMLLRSSFFGNLATRLRLVNADEWCATAATDGRNFYYNSRFIKMLRPKEIEFLFGHEVLHCVYDHFGRRGERDPQLWNIANDYCVNSDLKKHRVGEFITSVPCLYDTKYDGWSSEQVYDHLYENAEKIDIDKLIDRMLDEHLDQEEDPNDSDSNNPGNSKKEGASRPKPMSAEERAALRDEIKEAVLSAAQTCDAGNLPAGVKRMIQDLTEPKMDWRELLRMQLESTIKSDFTWQRPSRKGWHMEAVMPGMRNNDMIDIAVAIDMSGSISDTQGRDFLGEIQGIMSQFESYRIHVFCFDTEVYNPQKFDSDNLDDIADYELKGGGGTDFDAIFRYLKEEEIEPRRLVVFTDGYPYGSWGDANYCDTVWIIHGNPNPDPPFGVWVDYQEKA